MAKKNPLVFYGNMIAELAPGDSVSDVTGNIDGGDATAELSSIALDGGDASGG